MFILSPTELIPVAPQIPRLHLVLCAFLLITSIFAAFGSYGYKVLQKPEGKKRVIIIRIVGAAGLAGLIASVLWLKDIERSHETAVAEQKASVAEHNELITESLLERYQVADVMPIETDENNLYTSWPQEAYENNPLSAPQSNVLLQDGTVVTWGVIADATTGEASFVAHADGTSSNVLPQDVDRFAASTEN